jgi:uncharacterized BrkB/YihY/UPF0761 family membrane protein
MQFFKSLLVGLLAAVIAATLVLLGGMVAVAVFPHAEETAITIDPLSVVRSSPALWALAIVVFALGFLWEYKHAKPRLPK